MQRTCSFFQELKMPLEKGFGWLNYSLGVVKGKGVQLRVKQPAALLCGRVDKCLLSSVHSGGCGGQMTVKQINEGQYYNGYQTFSSLSY